jgi:hydroxymethylpyrimidine/phosphomethylpyrimidine kinase
VKLPPRVLIIAGSDSGGGAGIQGDIKTATVLGAYAMAAVTAVTVQNTSGVARTFPVAPDVVSEQIRAVLSDIGADAVKTGMLVSAEIVKAVTAAVQPYPAPLVVDTVIIAKGGTPLLDDSGIDALQTCLFPLAALVTPNIPEAERLTGMSISSPDAMVAAGEELRKRGARAVLVKGGHLSAEYVTDVLVTDSGVHIFSGTRLHNPATHGTGCALATAIAVGLAKQLPLLRTVEPARDFVRGAIGAGLAFGRGTGPINHLHAAKE